MPVFEPPTTQAPRRQAKRPAEEDSDAESAVPDPETTFTSINDPRVEKPEPETKQGWRARHRARIVDEYGLDRKPRDANTLAQQHIIVLNTMIHRCILQRDFKRANRAFGLLLRSEYQRRNRNALDLRNIWDIGLQILLEERDSTTNAVDYLDILSVNYPYRSWFHFPKGMGRWKGDDPDMIDVGATTGKEGKGKSGKGVAKSRRAKKHTAADFMVKSFEYQALVPEASMERILERLRDAMLMTPWSDDVRLWYLRGMVGLCHADQEKQKLHHIPAQMRKAWAAELLERETVFDQTLFTEGNAKSWSQWRDILLDVRKSYEEVESRHETIGDIEWVGLERLERWCRGDAEEVVDDHEDDEVDEELDEEIDGDDYEKAPPIIKEEEMDDDTINPEPATKAGEPDIIVIDSDG